MPNTSSRIRIGTPRKLFIGGCPGGKPDERRVVGEGRSRIGAGSSISAPSRPLPCGRCPIRVDDLGGHADVDELGEPAVGAITPERGVAGADQLPGRLDDAPQHRGQRQLAGDHLVGPQQTPQPALGGHDLLRALDQLRQQLIELQPRQVREGQIPAVGVLTGSGEPGVGPDAGRRAPAPP